MLEWTRWKCRPYGIRVRKTADIVEMSREGRVMRLSPKYVFFAQEICSDFDAYSHALSPAEVEGITNMDFALRLEDFGLARRCLQLGVKIEYRDNEIWLRKDERVMILSSRHLVYAWDMAQKFDIYFSPLVPEARGASLVLDYSRPGKLQTYRKSGLQFEMASFPEEEEAIEEYFRWYRPNPGETVFDIGAHCGVTTYCLSTLVGPNGRVISFEPDPINYSILQRNIERHGLTNVTAQNVALAGTAGRLQFNSEGTIGSALVSQLFRDSVGSIIEVDAVTLSDAFEKWGEPAFCKIDIEGAELDVVANSGDLLRKCQTNFALDTNHPKANGEMTNREIEAMFRSYGYEVASEANPLLTTWARRRAS
jgi:FkbM family methyltransferase